MITAKEILELIEKVDVNDEKKLNIINYTVNWYLTKVRLGDGFNCPCDEIWFKARERSESCPDYCRSRDALKSIRPEGWMIYELGQDPLHGLWHCTLINLEHGGENAKQVEEQLTEELAELHAIIQAIDYERGEK